MGMPNLRPPNLRPPNRGPPNFRPPNVRPHLQIEQSSHKLGAILRKAMYGHTAMTPTPDPKVKKTLAVLISGVFKLKIKKELRPGKK